MNVISNNEKINKDEIFEDKELKCEEMSKFVDELHYYKKLKIGLDTNRYE